MIGRGERGWERDIERECENDIDRQGGGGVERGKGLAETDTEKERVCCGLYITSLVRGQKALADRQQAWAAPSLMA